LALKRRLGFARKLVGLRQKAGGAVAPVLAGWAILMWNYYTKSDIDKISEIMAKTI